MSDVIEDWDREFTTALDRGQIDRAEWCFREVLKLWRLSTEREKRTLENAQTLLAVLEGKPE